MSADFGDNHPDFAAWWMPFTANRQFKADPRLLTEARGMYYRAADGQEVLDGTSGLWCVNAGHGRAEIAEAVRRQLMTLDFAPSFQMGHPIGFEFAQALTKIAPAGMDRVFFTNSGSESVDTALKIAMAYHRARGEGQRVKLIGREKGYHGVGFGGLSVGGLVNNRRSFVTLPGVDHLPSTYDLARNAFSRGLPVHGAEKADALEGLIALHGAETIAAVIVEPVAGSAGVLPPPVGYLARLREICDRHGILLIFDEVITGFGRVGAAFASQAFGATPDIMTTAKGLTNGVIPMGAVFVRRAVHDAVVQGPEGAIEFFHGYTYSGHPVACAAGLAVLEIYAREELFGRVAALAPLWEAALHALRAAPHVIDIRNVGLMGAIELSPRDGAPGARGYEVLVSALKAGLLVRATGDTIALSPPLIISQAEIDKLTGILGGVLAAIA
ncbi:MAG: aspartate aminotransferase family protein [Phenylobacterium sp.]|uniref:aspartate aminotransferase family protein n=1 Tax=Phenylobacterium sp. TaxID=1871053 RepID=UPI002718C20A|nr:aspartate aminotransferase family protein [Phenylobacterium sp.]MDO8912652.1 aspartate aminotransferase family protein [Phenylobacterium sp.]MDP3101918.1 aspartate aminotransferase family protein [Phenylobacterium sp.]